MTNIGVIKQKTAYEMRISDRSSDGCAADREVADGPQIVAEVQVAGGLNARENPFHVLPREVIEVALQRRLGRRPVERARLSLACPERSSPCPDQSAGGAACCGGRGLRRTAPARSLRATAPDRTSGV